MSEVVAQQPISKSDRKITRSLERETGHGFTVHQSLQDMHEFFTRDEDLDPGAMLQPPIFKQSRVSKKELAKSQGLL